MSLSKSLSLGFLTLMAACASKPPPSHADPVATPPPPRGAVPKPSAPKPLASGSARYVPTRAFQALPDGRLVAVSGDRRIVIRGDSAQVIDASPIDDLGRGRAIPEKLGGGFLFIGDRSVRFGATYDGALNGIASGPDKSSEEVDVGVGHNRVLVRFGQSPAALYELPSGKPLPLEPKGLTELFGTPSGMVAATTANGELYVSSAPGAAWKKVQAPKIERMGYDGKGVVLHGGKGTLRLGFDGKVIPRPNEPGLIVSQNIDAFDEFPDLSNPPPESDADRLLSALTKSMGPDAAFAVKETDLVFLDAKTGKVTSTVAGAFAGKENCFPIRGGAPAFVGCNSQTEMALYRIDTVGGKPVLEKTFKGVYTQSFGEPLDDDPLGLYGRCDGTAAPGVFCIRESAQRWKELPAVSDPAGLLANVPFMVHVAISKEGHAFAFGWLGGGGDLVIVDSARNKVRRVPTSKAPPWAGSLVNWHAMTIEKGTLRFLVASMKPPPFRKPAQESSAGIIEIKPDDSVRAERLDGRLAPNGARALHAMPDGKLRETVDAGRSFREIEPPPGGIPGGDGIFGCHDTGCELGPWYRVGWGG